MVRGEKQVAERGARQKKKKHPIRRVFLNSAGLVLVGAAFAFGSPGSAESIGRYDPRVSQSDIAACGPLANVPIFTTEQAGGHNFLGPSTEACPVWVMQFRLIGSPAAPEAAAWYQYLIGQGVNPGSIDAWLTRESNLSTDRGDDVTKQNICNIMYQGSVKDYRGKGGWDASFKDCVAMVEYWTNHGSVPGIDGQSDNQIDHVLYIISPPNDNNDTPEMISTIKRIVDKLNQESLPNNSRTDAQMSVALLPTKQDRIRRIRYVNGRRVF